MAQGTTRGVPIDIDPLLAADSNLLVPSQKAIKTYVDAGLLTKQGTLTLTTTGTSGAATLVGSTLNIPQYSGGGGGTPGGATGNIQFNSSGAFAGSNNLFWDNTNNRLGIGTASPTNDFTLSKSVNGNTDILNFNSSTGTSALTRFIVRNDTNNEGQLFASGSNWSGYGSMTGNAVGFYSSLLNGIQIAADGNFTQTRIQFMTGTTPSTKMVIQNNGNVQIGTTTDAGYKLDVNGTARAVTSLQTPTLLGNTTSGGTLTLQSTSNATKGKILFGTSAYDEVNNRLGIGTASPTVNLNVVSSTNTGITARNTSTSGRADLLVTNDAGNVGGFTIYGSAFGAPFSNNVAVTSFKSLAMYSDGGVINGGTSTIDFITGGYNNNPSMRITGGNTGNVLIGTSTDAGYKLDVNGTARVTGSTTASSAIARGAFISNTLVAAANSDRLVGLDINPTFTNGAFTGVWNVPLRVSNDVIIGTDITTLNSASFVNEKVFIGRNGSGTSNGFLGLIANSLSAPTAGISAGALLGFNASTTNFYGQGVGEARNSKFDIWFQTGAFNGGGYRFYTGTQENVTIFDNGNMLLQAGGTKTNAGFRLDVNGTTRLNGNTTFGNGAFWDNTNNRFGIGLSAANATLQVSDNGGGQRGISVDSYNSSGFEASFVMRSARGTMASPSQTLNGDGLGFFGFRGYSSGGAFLSNSSAYVEAYAIDNFTNTAAGARLVFATTPSGSTTSAVNMTINGNGNIQFPATNTAAGTTGNQTINKTSGTVNIAAAGTTITVTNSLVTTSSIVFATIRTNDATAVIKNVVPAAGSFTINLNAAATAETSIGFFVIN